MEAVVNSNQVNSVGEGLRLEVGFRLTERLEADGASTNERIVVLADAHPQLLVHLIEKPIDFVCFFVAMLLQTRADVSL